MNEPGCGMCWTLFITFLRIGAFTIGGGYAMLPLIQREITKNGWMTEEEFTDAFAVTQALPGVFAVNISLVVGYKLRKLKGAFICVLGSVLPSFLTILLVALFFNQVSDNIWVEKMFKGLRPASVALIAVPCLTTALALKLRRITLVIPLIAALLIWLADVSPVYVILTAALGGIVYDLWIVKK